MERKIILDTNIWVSYFITSRFKEITKIIVDNNLVVYTCDSMIKELEEVLSRRKFHKKMTLGVSFYVELHKNLTSYFPTHKKFSGSPDIKDDYLFDLAMQTEAKIIVTGDKKLLDFKVENISLITLSEFINTYT